RCGFESPHFPNFTHRFITVKVGHHDINQNSVNVRRLFQTASKRSGDRAFLMMIDSESFRRRVSSFGDISLAVYTIIGRSYKPSSFFNPSSKSKPDMSGKAKSTTMQSK